VSLESEAFGAFPYGLLVLDRGGLVVRCNREATRLIGSLGLAKAELTCCSLLGCRQRNTVLEAACLTELALGRDVPLPEIRVDVRSASGACALWVTAAAIGGAGERVVLQLRPGVTGDRRRRTSPHWMSAPRLRIRTLGATSVESVEGPIGGAWLDQRAGQLLKYLVAERRRAVAVDEIGESIWPGADYAVGASVRYYVHALRRRLEPERGAQRRLVTGGGQQFGLARDQRVEEALHHRARLRADELVDDRAVAERLDGGNALDAKGLREPLVGVGVDLRQHDRAFARPGGLLEQRRQGATRTAPRGPEVDDDRRRAGALDDLGVELGLADIHDRHRHSL